MKKKIVIVGTFILLCLILVCGFLIYWSLQREGTGTTSSDRTYSFMNTSYLPEGVFEYDGQYINYTDAATGEKNIICDDVACQHKYKKNASCGAVFYDVLSIQGITIWKDRLVYISANEGVGKNTVFECQLNGKDRKEIGKLPYMEAISWTTYYKDMLYVCYQSNVSATQEYSKVEVGIYALNLETGEGKYIFKNEAYSAAVYGISVNADYLSFTSSYMEADAKEIMVHKEDEEYVKKHLRKEVIVIDRAKEEKIFSTAGEFFGAGEVVGDCVLYMEDEKAYILNIKTGERKEVYEEELYQIPAHDKNAMYLKAYDKETGKCVYYRYYPKKDIWKEIGRTELSVEAICGDTVHFIGNQDGSLKNGFIDKKDFLEENYKKCQWQKEKGGNE